MPSLSVIIPTYRRANILTKCLSALECQTIASELEVIVVSDGHDDKTSALFVKPQWSLNLRFIEIPKSHQGVARNAGVAVATAPITLFLGDDFFLEPQASEVHLQTYKLSTNHYSLSTLGFTTWDPAVGITPAMRWLEASGWQFGYPQIAQYAHQLLPAHIQHQFTYTSHISLPTDIARAHPFKSDVSLYGWEDI